MKKERKAVLLSALLYPGAGHLFLKKYLIGFGFISAFSYLLFSIISFLNQISDNVILKVTNGEIALTLDTLTQAVSAEIAQQPQHYHWLGYALLFIWLLSIFDTYRLAKQERASQKNSNGC